MDSMVIICHNYHHCCLITHPVPQLIISGSPRSSNMVHSRAARRNPLRCLNFWIHASMISLLAQRSLNSVAQSISMSGFALLPQLLSGMLSICWEICIDKLIANLVHPVSGSNTLVLTSSCCSYCHTIIPDQLALTWQFGVNYWCNQPVAASISSL